MTKCPKCDATIASVRIDPIKATSKRGTFDVIAYSCPTCDSALSIGIDFLLFQADTLEKIRKMIGRA